MGNKSKGLTKKKIYETKGRPSVCRNTQPCSTNADNGILQGRVEAVSSVLKQALHVFTRNKDVADHKSDQQKKS